MNIQQLTERYWLILQNGGLWRTPINGWYLQDYLQRANENIYNADIWLRNIFNINRPSSPELGFGKKNKRTIKEKIPF